MGEAGGQEGRTPPAIAGREERGHGGGPFPVLPTPDRYALASFSKHLLAHSKITRYFPTAKHFCTAFLKLFRPPTLPPMVEVVEEGLAKKLAKGASERKFFANAAQGVCRNPRRAL